jgi:NitT/TauT family transport system permease protein
MIGMIENSQRACTENEYNRSKTLISVAKTFAIGFVAIIVIWQLAIWAFDPPKYILPNPFEVLTLVVTSPLIGRHFWITIVEALTGLGIAVVCAFTLSVLSVHSRIIRAVVFPVAVAIQVSPKIALAPLFILWFGYGLFPKFIIAALIAFFPLLANIFKGLQSLDRDALDLFTSLAATPLEILWKARIPACLPYFFVALKTAAGYSLVGAVIGEFVGADRGLGYLIVVSTANLETPMLFASFLILTFFGVCLYVIICLFESWLVKGYEKSEEDIVL